MFSALASLVAKSNLSFDLLKVDTHLNPPVIVVTSNYFKIMPVPSYYSRIILTKLLTKIMPA